MAVNGKNCHYLASLPALSPAASARAKPLVSAIRSRPLTQISSGGISYRAIATVLSIRARVVQAPCALNNVIRSHP
jgi:hypothetical protein